MSGAIRFPVLEGSLPGPLANRLEHVYAAAFSEPPCFEGPEDTGAFRARLVEEAHWPGFRMAIAADEAPIGFAYGYRGTPGMWWPDLVAYRLPGYLRWWADDSFAFMEMAVVPNRRCRGDGRALHDALLDGVGCRTALLTTYDDATPARRLYQRAGWREMVRRFRSPGCDDPYVLMGLEVHRSVTT